MKSIRLIYSSLKNNTYSKDFIFFSIGYFLCSLISLINLHLINKNLVPEELGRFSYFKSLFELLASILSLNLYGAYLRFNNKGFNPTVQSLVIKHLLCAFSILSLIYFVLTKEWTTILFAFILFSNERSYYFRSLLKMKELNIQRVIAVLVTLLVTIFIVLFQNKDGVVSAYIILISYSLGYATCFWFYRSKYNSESFVKEQVRYSILLKFCIPAALLIIVDWSLNYTSQLLIKNEFGYTELAPYAVAQNALSSIKLFTGLFLMFYPSLYYKEIEKGNISTIRLSRNLMMFVLLFIVLALCFFTKQIYMLLGASAYIAFDIYFKLLLFVEFFKVSSSFFAIYLSYQLRTFTSFCIMSSGAILNVALLFLFLHKYGIIFACYSSMLSFAIIFAINFFYSKRLETKFIQERTMTNFQG